jgi:3-oxoacyl-[acyl-carrier-protein] synthase III
MTRSQHRAVISGTGSALPEAVLGNDFFTKTVDTSSEWIEARTGILERRKASPSESTGTLAVNAARQALTNAGMTAADIDLIVCATITPEMIFPSTACYVQAALGCRTVGAFDLLAACSGFIYALSVGRQYIESGAAQNVLVIGAETLTRITDYQDRGTCILFGDGAGAAVISRGQGGGAGILHCELYAEGGHDEWMSLPAGGSRIPASHASIDNREHYMKIAGKQVFRFAATRMQELIASALSKCELTIDDVAMIIPHQVNQRIIDHAAEALGIGKEKFMVNIERYGNTSAASVPIALDEARRQGRVKSGDTVIMVAFGGGLTWANAVVTL